MGDGRHDGPVRKAVAAEAIGDEPVRYTTAPLEQLAKEPRGCLAIPVGLEQKVDDFAVLIDGPPEVLTQATNRHNEFFQVPRVADWPRTMPKPPRVREAEGRAPVPDGFVRDGDASVRKEVCDVAEAQREAVVQPDGVADDRRGESVAGRADRRGESERGSRRRRWASGYSARGPSS